MRRITVLLVIGLVALNAYLFLVRGLPLPDKSEMPESGGTISTVAVGLPESAHWESPEPYRGLTPLPCDST